MDEIIEPAASAAPEETGAGAGAFPDRLAAHVATFAPTGFAVLDGSHDDDLPGMLRKSGLFGRSLFLDHADLEVERAGPWLVSLAQADDAPDRVFDLVGGKPSAVFWSCEGGEAVLYRHLRTLNMVRIPAWAATGERGPRDDASASAYETVMFRHWDPRVLAALLPVLDAAHFARIIGPTHEMVFFAKNAGGLKRVLRDLECPQAPNGLLTIETEHLITFQERRRSFSHHRLAQYLRRFASADTKHLDDRALHSAVAQYASEARAFDANSERGIGLWAYLRLTSRADLSRDYNVIKFISQRPKGTTADMAISDLLDMRRLMLMAVRHS